MLFGLNIPFILNELKSKKDLRKYFNINEILTTNHVYKIFSKQNQETLLKALNRILNHHNGRKKDFHC